MRVDLTGADESEAIHEQDAHQEAVSTLVVELDDGSRAVLPRDYAEHSTSLGYALTVFRSQGITVDYAFGLGGDSLFQEAGYTQLSRGRLSNNLYVAAPDSPRWEVGHFSEDTTEQDQLDALVEALSSSREQIMAQDHHPSWPVISPDDLDTVYRQHADLGRWLAEHAPADVTDQLAESWNRDYAAPAVGREVQADREDLASLAQAQRQRNDWVARHQHEITAWSQLDASIRRYEYRLGQAAAFARPEHVTHHLGPLPERITGAERWQVAAGAVEAYRSRWSIAGEATIEPQPTNPEQRAHWDTMAATLAAAGFISPGGTSGQEADAPWLASLWDRVRDLDRVRDEAKLERVAAVEPPAWSWTSSRDSGYDHGRDDGFGL